MNKMWSPLGGSPLGPAGNSSPVSASGWPPRSLDLIASKWLDDRARERRLRFDVFSPEVVNDQGWLVLLELYRAQIQDRLVSNEGVAESADLPATTVLRYAAHLAAHDLVEQNGDRADSNLRLSEHGIRKLRSYFSKLARHQRVGAI